MTAGDPTGEGLAAALIQLSAHAEQIGSLDARESEHHRESADRLRGLAADVATLTSQAGDIAAALSRHTAILSELEGLGSQVAAFADRLALMNATSGSSSQYQPVAPPRWWKLTGPEREHTLDRLAAWVDQIYRPGYGRLAAALPPCWREHPVCLYTLDWLSELWSVLYLNPDRNPAALGAQAEWQTRLLPAAADQMTAEAGSCAHHIRPRRSP